MTFTVDSDSPEQAKVRIVVEWYKNAFPQEYLAFVEQNKIRQDNTLDEFATTGADPNSETRQIHEIPETMFKQLVTVLSPDEMVWFSSKKGSFWFANTFREFKVAQKL